jgi:hypothetical protein
MKNQSGRDFRDIDPASPEDLLEAKGFIESYHQPPRTIKEAVHRLLRGWRFKARVWLQRLARGL